MILVGLIAPEEVGGGLSACLWSFVKGDVGRRSRVRWNGYGRG